METLELLKQLYKTRDAAQEKISAIEEVLGSEPAPKQKRTRGPNKPKGETNGKTTLPTSAL